MGLIDLRPFELNRLISDDVIAWPMYIQFSLSIYPLVRKLGYKVFFEIDLNKIGLFYWAFLQGFINTA